MVESHVFWKYQFQAALRFSPKVQMLYQAQVELAADIDITRRVPCDDNDSLCNHERLDLL